jgi:hypothetical protein
LSYEGGLVPVGVAFVNTPAMLVSGDGRVYTEGVTAAIFPGPLLPTIVVRSISENGVQNLLAIVKRAGLLAPPPDYSGGASVSDAPNTVLTINAGGGDFVHSAYALGADTPESPDRKKLLEAVTAVADLEIAAGDGNLGDNAPFQPTVYRLQARAIDPSELTSQDVAPTVVDWPSATTFALAGATTCATVDAVGVGTMFTDAKQNTYFRDAGVVYQLAVAGVLPGDPPC